MKIKYPLAFLFGIIFWGISIILLALSKPFGENNDIYGNIRTGASLLLFVVSTFIIGFSVESD